MPCFAECEGWAASGGCNDDPRYMSLNCPVTCGVCKGLCKDKLSECPGWSAQDECYENPQWMYHTCPASCGVCEQSICADSNTTQCHIWHDSGECERNPMAVMKDCVEHCLHGPRSTMRVARDGQLRASAQLKARRKLSCTASALLPAASAPLSTRARMSSRTSSRTRRRTS